ncbi:hypothetical protein KVR01_000189 [Diaporthe batatas]|uniref:uncharacterized protein n=1 Tax=Diaporthe batatas TaxID=748121 RepID=UPI001D04D98F|nr:uncharacterized protein KVR01_000189 [Diaporthe batatas]KAG8169444.1 hypothetical protein KVR01_000189 [Diaporthe batatas]
MAYIDEWFVERRGLANGIFFGSNNFAAAACSPIFAIVLRKFGPRALLIAWAVIAGAGISLSIFFVRSRNTTRTAMSKQNFSWKPFAKPLFWLFALSMLVQGLANMLPADYLPSYCTDLGLPTAQGALLITVLSLSGMIGQFLLGLLTDKIGALVPLLLSTLVSAFAVLVLWGLGRSYWMLVILSILFGAFSFSFVVFRSHMAAAVVGDKLHPNEELVVSGALLATRGIACIASGYTGAAVVGASEHLGILPGYGAGKWQTLIIYEGVLMFGASMGALGFIRKRKLGAEGSKNAEDSDQGGEAVTVSVPVIEIVVDSKRG